MTDTIHTLFLAGYGKESGEKGTIPFVLANIEVEDKSKRVEVALMFEAARLALAGAADGFHIGVPFETHDLGTRMRMFMDAGGIINVCTPCLIHRNLDNAELMPGIVKINGRILMEKKDRANKILAFT
jgi:hypothetical protein